MTTRETRNATQSAAAHQGAQSVPNAFTPGPWKVAGNSVQTSAGGYVCELSCPRGSDERDATVRLIAETPNLYEVLSVIVANAGLIPDPATGESTDCYAVPIDDIEAAIAALAKARGPVAASDALKGVPNDPTSEQ